MKYLRRKPKKCTLCNGQRLISGGWGWASAADATTCSRCKGTGNEPGILRRMWLGICRIVKRINRSKSK